MIQITLNFATVEAARKALNEIPESLLIGALPTPKTEVVKSTVEVAKERAPKPTKTVEEAPAPAPAVEPPAPTAPIAKAVEETKADAAPEIDYPTLQKAVFTLAGKSRDAAKAVAEQFGVENFKSMPKEMWAKAHDAVQAKIAELESA